MSSAKGDLSSLGKSRKCFKINTSTSYQKLCYKLTTVSKRLLPVLAFVEIIKTGLL